MSKQARKKERKKERKTPGGLDVRTRIFVPNHCQIFQSKRSFGVRLGEKFCGKNYSKPAPIDDSVIIELDEMWHFLRSKKDELRSGRPTAKPQNSLKGKLELKNQSQIYTFEGVNSDLRHYIPALHRRSRSIQ